MSDCSNSVDKYIIVESADSGTFSGLTICGGGGLTVDFITGCTSDGVNLEGAKFQNNTLTVPTIYTTTLSGGTYYGDGSNLTGISTIDSYMTGGTYSNGNITFTGNNNFSNVIVDVSALIDDTNYYVTGGTVSGTNLILSRNGGLSDVTIDTSSYFDNTDNYVSGGTYSNGNLFFSGTSTNQSFTVDVSALLDDTNTFVTGGTLVNGNTLSLNYNNGGSTSDIDLSGIKFTGNTSGECITNLHVSNIHSCSPLNINPLNEGNVYFGQTSGVTIEIVDGRIIANYFRILNPPTSNQSLTQILGRNVSTGNVEFLSASTFVYKSDFDTYSGSVQSQINLKLNISDFSIYTGGTQIQLDSKLNKTEFDSYSSTTQTTIDSKISFSDAETRYVNVTGDTMSGTLILPAGTINDPSLVLSGGGTLLNTEQIGAFEFLGSSLYFTDQSGSRRNVLLAQSGFTATTVNALQDTEVSTVTNGQTWYYDSDTSFWRNTGILTIDDTNNKVDINSTLNVGGVFGITGSTVELNSSLDVYNGNLNLYNNSYFLQGTDTSDGNVSLIGVDNQNRVYIGNQGFDNYLADDTTINGDLHIKGDLTVVGSATTVNIISEDVLIADNFITLNSNVTGGTPTENAGIDISRGDETNSRILWNESTDLWEMGISGNTKRVILEGDSLALLTSGHTHPISEINGLQTELDSKLNKVEFDSYSGNVETELNSINSSLTGHTTDTNNPHQTSLGNLFGGSGHTHTLSEITNFSSYSGNVQTQLNTKIETASNLSGGTGLFSFKNGTNLEFKSISSSGNTVLISQNNDTVNLEVVHIADTKVTGFTYNDSNTLTISQNNGQSSYSTSINTVTALTVTNYVDFKSSKPSNFSGRTYFDRDENALSYYPETSASDVTINIGQESVIRVHNNTGVQINNGQVCHITSEQPSVNGVPSIILAIATGDTTTGAKYEVSGVATHNIPNGSEGFITKFGLVRDLNITGVTEGNEIYLSDTTPGEFLFTPPPTDSRRSKVGYVVTTGTTTGKILVELNNENSVSVLSNTRLGIVTENNSSTGLREGGVMSINGGDNTLLDISAGSGIIVNNHTYSENPTITNVSWDAITGITITNLTGETGSFIFIDSDGNPFQLPNSTPPNGTDRRNYIYLGLVGHANKTNLINVFNTPNILTSPINQLNDLNVSIGPFSVNGNALSNISGTLQLVKNGGNSYESGGNFSIIKSNPSIIDTPLLSGSTLVYAKQDVVLGPTSVNIDPSQYDNGGTLTALSNNNKLAAHRIWHEPINNLLIFQYGQAEYDSVAQAKENFVLENYVVPNGLAQVAYLVGIIITTKVESDLDNAIIIPQGKFAGTGGGGGLSVTTLQGAYNNSTSPEITTDSSRTSIDFRAGSGLDSTNVITFQQNSGTINGYVTGEGNSSFKNVSGTTFYGDGSNLTGIVHTTDTFVSGGTYSTGNIFFSGNSSDTSFIVDVSALLDDTNSYVTGSTLNGNTLELSRNGGLSTLTTDLSQFIDNTDNFVTGGTLNGQTLVLNRTNALSAVTIDLSTFLTETEADDKYLLNTTDTLNGDLIVTGNTSIGGTLNVNSVSANTLTITGDTKLNGLVVEGQSTFRGSPTTFGNSFGDSVDFTARVNGNFVPVNNPGGNIGDPDRYWSNFYITNVSASTINISNVGTGTSVNNLGIDASGNIVNGTDVGEVNTASNVGVGTGVFSGKSGTDLQFYSLSGGTNTTLTLNDNTLVIDSTAGGSTLTVKEIDGTPSVNNVDTIRFSNGTVTDDGGGQVTVVVSGGTGSGFGDEAKIFSWFMNIT